MVTSNVNTDVTPGLTRARAIAPPSANTCAELLNTGAPSCLITMLTFEHRSDADPLTVPLADWLHAPGASVNMFAAIVPVFVIFTVVDFVWPGTMPRSPP